MFKGPTGDLRGSAPPNSESKSAWCSLRHRPTRLLGHPAGNAPGRSQQWKVFLNKKPMCLANWARAVVFLKGVPLYAVFDEFYTRKRTNLYKKSCCSKLVECVDAVWGCQGASCWPIFCECVSKASRRVSCALEHSNGNSPAKVRAHEQAHLFKFLTLPYFAAALFVRSLNSN